MVVGTAIALGLALLCAWRLLGLWPAFLGFLLIAFDPFHIGLTRLLHLDGLMASLLLLASLSFICFLLRGRNILFLFLAIVASGLALLTKTPSLVLVPFFGILFLDEVWRLWRVDRRFGFSSIWRTAWPYLVWGVGSAAIFVALWPIMWVDPLGTLQKIFDVMVSYAVEGHFNAVFFNGQAIEGDPGWMFYPVSYLWRTTPAVLIGLFLCGLAYVRRWPPLDDKITRRVAIYLALFAVLFAVQMSLGAKKFDRYLIPSFLPLDLLAGVGWACLGIWFWQRATSKAIRYAVVAGLFLVVGSQAFLALRSYPYYINYFNPLVGGSARAPRVMMIGWGEGLDQAARYLNQLPGAKEFLVMSYYPDGSFSYFFDGKTLELPHRWDGADLNQFSGVDFVVLYFHQWQRQVSGEKLLAYFNQFAPEFVARIDGLDYARVYNLRNQALDPQIP
jgi:4-amino-4-deoxy-L-arabinose transferase-like glycosyltransferase